MNVARQLTQRVPRCAQAKPIMIRLAPEEIEKADRYASQEVRSRASFLRLMILKGIQEYEREIATNQ